MSGTKWVYNDGGRSKYYKGKEVGDCVIRAIAIASQEDYKLVYKQVAKYQGSTPRNGCWRPLTKKYLVSKGWLWTPTMFVGCGCKVHLRSDELPDGRLIVALSRHYVAVIDGTVNDTYDCTRNGTRCVYGYWSKTDG